MNKTKIVLLFAAVVILLSNLFPVRLLIEPIIRPYEFETSNSEFVFTTVPAKERDTDLMERHFQDYLKNNPQTTDTVIYRTFKRNPLKFWNWRFYLTSDLYKYPVKN